MIIVRALLRTALTLEVKSIGAVFQVSENVSDSVHRTVVDNNPPNERRAITEADPPFLCQLSTTDRMRPVCVTDLEVENPTKLVRAV